MQNLPVVVKNLLILNVLVFFGMFVAERYGIDLNQWLGLHFFMADDFNAAQLFTYMFMHANFQHIFFNMLALWMFGRILENVWGGSRFLFYYIVCGLGAGLVQEAVQAVYYFTTLAQYDGVSFPNGVTISMGEFLNMWNTVGASGAVYGILLAFGMLFPNEQMFVFPLPFPIKAKWFVLGYAVIELMLGLGNSAHDNVAHFAHLGGMLFGFLVLLYWKKKGRMY